ncbi:MAG: hypothetical protein HYZ57_01570 [Acidobacteria bacterium]|nr:hypothetical protein [Acidobacteriota bacterium]MBI3278512.1 hypothetical protein [Acidobacteriota bacterium]
MPEGIKASSAIQQLVAKGLFDRLPPTFSTFFYDRIQDWELLFPAEQSYFERLFGLLDRSEAEAVNQLFAPLREIERRMGVNDKTWNTREFTLAHVDFLNRSPDYPQWRQAVSGIFAKIDPILDEQVARHGRPRLVMVLSPSELPASPDRMWTRIATRGKRVAVKWSERQDFAALLTGTGEQSLARAYAATRAPAPHDTWVIEAGSRLAPAAGQGVAHLSYDGLRDYRTRLMDEVRKMVEAEDIRGPRQLGERLRRMKMPSARPEIDSMPVLADFTRSVLLNGNGTLLINNTFVEWTTVQAVRRARPSVVLISFGIRNKVKPFSSLLIYTDQDRATPIPTQMDTLGSYVDLEIFYQYIWSEFEKYPEYRHNTAYIFAADGMEEVLIIAPPDFPTLMTAKDPLPLENVHAALREWLSL